MKKIIVYLISLLLFIFTNPSLYSADITEFQIDNITINDSLLNYFTEEEIKKETFFYREQKNNKEFGNINIIRKIKGSIYDDISVTYNTSDKKYLIKNIVGIIKFENNISECLKKREEIIKEVSVLFKDNKTFDWSKQSGNYDHLGITISSKDYNDYLYYLINNQ